MRLWFWPAVLALAGLALATAVGVELSRQTGHRVTVGAGDHSDDITGSLGGSATSNYLPLSDEQRSHILDGIMTLHDAPVESMPTSETELQK
jgi:hypothetical protein